ncbi:Leucine aminopeptidase 1 [Borealophlyctis nickersoniae]|nr:Leucine aminopeptidase 1 [Borealophlyctis nickersoniae]
MRLTRALIAAAGACLTASMVLAAPAPPAAGLDQIALAGEEKNAGKRLISTSEVDSSWLTEDQIFDLIRSGTKFIDITDGDLENLHSFKEPKRFAPPEGPTHQSLVRSLTNNVSESRMRDFLTTFTGFKTRYYKSASGAASAEWLFEQIQDVAQQANKGGKLNVSVSKFEHDWDQFSIIARIEKAGGQALEDIVDDGIVIVAAHQDSVNQWNPWWGRSPGADDDGSGTTSVFEAFQLLLENNVAPGRTIEFHWYSAEEGGLLGSQKVAAAYRRRNVEVAGMLQCDMTGWSPEGKKRIVGIATDYVDSVLSRFLQKLSKEYNGIPWKDVKCGYGCSDHASWTKAGYASAFTFESDFDDHNPYIHTAQDDITHINFAHVAEYARLAIAFAVELSLPKSTPN